MTVKNGPTTDDRNTLENRRLEQTWLHEECAVGQTVFTQVGTVTGQSVIKEEQESRFGLGNCSGHPGLGLLGRSE